MSLWGCQKRRMDSPLIGGDSITTATVIRPLVLGVRLMSLSVIDSFQVGSYQGQKARLTLVNKLTLI